MTGSHAATADAIDVRIDRLPSSPPIWSWIVRLSLGAFFEIYELALMALMGPLLLQAGIFRRTAGHLGFPDHANFAFVTFAGQCLGVLGFAFATDRCGRRPVFMASLLIYATATLAMAMQTTASGICGWRFVAAIGIGAEIVAVDAYLGELIPKRLRGRGFAISKALQFTAVPFATALAALAARGSLGGIAGWRLILLVPAVGAVLVWRLRRDLPESPRWLARHGRGDEAGRIVADLEQAVRRTGRTLVQPDSATPDAASVGPVDLLGRRLRGRVVMMIVAGCSSSIAYYGFGNWLPTIIQSHGVPVTKSLFYTAMIALAYPLTPLGVASIADRFERKWQIVAGAGTTVVAGLTFALQTGAIGWLLCGLLVTVGNNMMACASHTYRSELFPTNVRGRAIGLIYACDRIVAGCSSYAIAWLLMWGSGRVVLVFVTGAALVDMAAIGLFGPRTRALASEEIGNAHAVRPDRSCVAPISEIGVSSK